MQQREFNRQSTLLGMAQQELAGARQARAQATADLGGALGPIGNEGAISGSTFIDAGTFLGTPNGTASISAISQTSQINNMTIDNFYSGSFDYEMSFLDKDHTLILDLNKDVELQNGIGSNGVIIIPETATSQIANNIEFYLAQAGIVENTVGLTQNLNYSQTPPPGTQ